MLVDSLEMLLEGTSTALGWACSPLNMFSSGRLLGHTTHQVDGLRSPRLPRLCVLKAKSNRGQAPVATISSGAFYLLYFSRSYFQVISTSNVELALATPRIKSPRLNRVSQPGACLLVCLLTQFIYSHGCFKTFLFFIMFVVPRPPCPKSPGTWRGRTRWDWKCPFLCS